MESSGYRQIALLAPNPTVKRGFRVSLALHPTLPLFAYTTQNNVVIRNLENLNDNQSLVYTDFMSKVTCVQYSPNGAFLAAGDDKGKVRIFSYNQESKEFIVKKEHSMLAGQVNAIAWTDDGQRIAAAGEGKDSFAKAVLADSGTKVGDLFGPNKTINTLDIKQKPYRLVMAGEGHEIYTFDGVPFKVHKSIKPHSNFINRIVFSKDGKHFVSVSSDKTICLIETDTLEVVQKIEKAHNKGITDVNFISEDTIVTISSDNTVKLWNIREGKELKTLQVREDGTEVLENQQLGLLTTADSYLTVTLNSNLNLWRTSDVHEKNQLTPAQIVQGHQNYIQNLTYTNGFLISSDQDGKIFSWGENLTASLFQGEGHSTSISHLTSLGNNVYSGSTDGVVKRSVLSEGVWRYKSELKLEAFVLDLVAGQDNNLYVLQNNNKLAIIETEGFTVSKLQEIKDFEATALTYVNGLIWLGDKKGLIHILDPNSMNETAVIEKKHNHAISYLKASRDGKLVASGDVYRYIYVFNAENLQEVGCFAYHTAKIIQLDFNKDSTLLLTASLDLGVGVANLADKSKRLMHRTNQKELTSAVFDDGDRLFTAGYDCAIRQWSL